MPHTVTPEEIRGVFSRAPAVRYRFFCQRVLDTGAAWYAKLDDLIFTVSQQDKDYIAFWSDEEFARSALSLRHPHATFFSVPVEELMLEKLPSLERDIDLAIMVSADGLGHKVTPRELLNDLRNSEARYLSNQIGFGTPEDVGRWLRKITKPGPSGRLP